MSKSVEPARRPRTSREEARGNMLRAARELLEIMDPDQLTVREIAEHAGHHHRFVQDWFGGKAGLYMEVLNELSSEMAVEVEVNQVQGQPDSRVVQAVLLVAWLVANEPDLVAGDRLRPLVNRLESYFYDRFGVSREDARLLARHGMLVVAGYVVFKDAFDLKDEDYLRLVGLEFVLGQSLGTRSGE
jgi:AcrR family transcriptional regulator